MVGIGVALTYAGYCGVLQCLFWLTGKNVGPKQLFGTAWPPNVPGASAANSQQPTQPTTAAGQSAALQQGGTAPLTIGGQSLTQSQLNQALANAQLSLGQ